MKTCTKCGIGKPVAEFARDASKRDGLRSHCKECCRAGNAAWYVANPDKVKASAAAWRAANPEKYKAASVKWIAANSERKKAYDDAWAAANPDKRKASCAKWKSANRDKIKKAYAAWAKTKPESIRIRNQNRRARASGGKLSNGLADKLVKLQRGKCACGCGQLLGTDYHLDHIMPLALGGTNTDNNIQLLRKLCNLQKKAKHPVEFMQQRGFLL